MSHNDRLVSLGSIRRRYTELHCGDRLKKIIFYPKIKDVGLIARPWIVFDFLVPLPDATNSHTVSVVTSLRPCFGAPVSLDRLLPTNSANSAEIRGEFFNMRSSFYGSDVAVRRPVRRALCDHRQRTIGQR